jgi:hypothetical protein
MEYAEYNFVVNGVKFVSRLNKLGSMYHQVERIGAGAFVMMNESAIMELMGNPAELSLNEIKVRLYDLNAGATQALIELGA